VSVKKVLILNGQINATRSSGAGIGSGFECSGNSTVDSITIEGGAISAQAENASAIGSHYSHLGNSHVKKIFLVAGAYNFTAKGGASIGSEYADGGNSTVESVQILSGTYFIRSDSEPGTFYAVTFLVQDDHPSHWDRKLRHFSKSIRSQVLA
jgi:hypothetical protein